MNSILLTKKDNLDNFGWKIFKINHVEHNLWQVVYAVYADDTQRYFAAMLEETLDYNENKPFQYMITGFDEIPEYIPTDKGILDVEKFYIFYETGEELVQEEIIALNLSVNDVAKELGFEPVYLNTYNVTDKPEEFAQSFYGEADGIDTA